MFHALSQFGAVIAGLSSLVTLAALIVWAAVRLVERVEYERNRRNWPGLWTRRIWGAECPTCGAPSKQLCVAVDPGGAVPLVPHLPRLKRAGIAAEWHSEAMRAYTFDACFILYGPGGHAHARRMLRSLAAGSDHDHTRAAR